MGTGTGSCSDTEVKSEQVTEREKVSWNVKSEKVNKGGFRRSLNETVRWAEKRKRTGNLPYMWLPRYDKYIKSSHLHHGSSQITNETINDLQHILKMITPSVNEYATRAALMWVEVEENPIVTWIALTVLQYSKCISRPRLLVKKKRISSRLYLYDEMRM